MGSETMALLHICIDILELLKGTCFDFFVLCTINGLLNQFPVPPV